MNNGAVPYISPPQVVVGDRQSGKTTKLIKLSAKTGATIICSSRNAARHTIAIAKHLKLTIPTPQTYDWLLSGQSLGYDYSNGVLLDDIDLFLRHKLGHVAIKAMSIDGILPDKPNTMSLKDKQRSRKLRRRSRNVAKLSRLVRRPK